MAAARQPGREATTMNRRLRASAVGVAVLSAVAVGAGPAQAGAGGLTGAVSTGRTSAGSEVSGASRLGADLRATDVGRERSGAVVVEWNQALLRILRTPGAQPATVHPTRSFAILQAAIYDAVVSAEHRGAPYLFRIVAPRRTSATAAAAQAGHDALLGLYPSFAATLDAQLQTELAGLPADQARRDGVRVGQLSARFILAIRSDDGSQPQRAAAGGPQGGRANDGTVSAAEPDAGVYRPTPPAFSPPVFTTWATVTPWLIRRADQFRPGQPPRLDSQAYARALNEVASLGRDTSTTRTADQTVVARFWSAPIQNYWNEITQTLVNQHHADLLTTATVFAQVDLALADSVIAFYDAKYHYALWRPVTAIRAADTDGNAATNADPAWTPLVNTPADPSYPGAHSVASAAAASILADTFGDRERLTVSSELLPGTTRSFTSLHAVVAEAGLSRLYAGVHTRVDHEAGLQLGARLGAFVLGNGFHPSR
jgi:membrane-associated phospholipid phosphatase